MNSQYKAGTSVTQVLIALVATVLIGSVALVGTVGQAQALPTAPVSFQIAAHSHG